MQVWSTWKLSRSEWITRVPDLDIRFGVNTQDMEGCLKDQARSIECTTGAIPYTLRGVRAGIPGRWRDLGTR